MTIPNRQNMYFRLSFFVKDEIVPDKLDANVLDISPLPYFWMNSHQLNSFVEKPIQLPAVPFGFVSVNPIFQYIFSISVCSGRPDYLFSHSSISLLA